MNDKVERPYVVGGVSFSKDEIVKINDTISTEGWELIGRIISKIQVDALESTFYAATPMEVSEYTHAHGEFSAVQKMVDFQPELKAVVNMIVMEEQSELIAINQQK